ncbi:phage tail protein [Kosakonia sp. YIM B13611]|uniref:phage tail protein n=1 Tax=unclassified Kosakonia TaxID=2632876 RepID=UPI003684E33F
MTAKFFAILTNQGAALLANATALGTKLNITQMAVGDGNGTLPTPDATQTKLVNQRRIAPLNMLSVDTNNSSQIIAEQVIPENEGGFWIREIGLYDDNGVLIAVANCPETYKPLLQEGSGRTQTIRMVLIVSSTAAVTLKIDPSVVLATRKYVDNTAIEVKGYADTVMKKHLSSANPHDQYLMTSNALKELVSASLVGDVLKNLGLGEAAKRDVGTGVNQIPDMSSFITGTVNAFRLPAGHIVQFDSGTTTTGTGTGGGFTKSYPTPFPHACLVLVGVAYGTLGYRVSVSTNTSDRTAANMNFVDQNGNGIPGIPVGYIAIGY